MLCHPADKLSVACISCARATAVWKQWKSQCPAIAPQHEYAHVVGSGPVGQTDTPLPSLGVSSLDLGRSHTERPLLCEDDNLPSHVRKCLFAEPADSYAETWLLQCKRIALHFVRRTS